MEAPSAVSTSRSDEQNDGNFNKCDARSVPAEASNARNKSKLKEKIHVLKYRRKYGVTNNITIVRSNNVLQALDLPTVADLNPRSVYNKTDEFHAFVEDENIDLIFMSESWERTNETLHQIIHLEDHMVISNVHQQKEVGGRPALVINSRKFTIQNLTNTVVQVSWGVEVVWALLTPKNVRNFKT